MKSRIDLDVLDNRINDWSGRYLLRLSNISGFAIISGNDSVLVDDEMSMRKTKSRNGYVVSMNDFTSNESDANTLWGNVTLGLDMTTCDIDAGMHWHVSLWLDRHIFPSRIWRRRWGWNSSKLGNSHHSFYTDILQHFADRIYNFQHLRYPNPMWCVTCGHPQSQQKLSITTYKRHEFMILPAGCYHSLPSERDTGSQQLARNTVPLQNFDCSIVTPQFEFAIDAWRSHFTACTPLPRLSQNLYLIIMHCTDWTRDPQ